ncbi:P27 family phage terminase small subunit [Paenibacillus sp. M1]|uniref:P27 family phage terminase small subunit n=1 Tax=Paenibacillus haidiansis TaxID=1574488 RepID=A0ABU7VMP8_9BACL
MNNKEVKALREELLGRVDPKSKIQLEKVERYVNLVEIYYQLDKAIKDHGIMITTINGSQEFTKPNPAIAEKNKINTSLIALGKDLGLDTPVKPAGESEDDSKNDLI